jgi:hypothetical protein
VRTLCCLMALRTTTPGLRRARLAQLATNVVADKAAKSPAQTFMHEHEHEYHCLPGTTCTHSLHNNPVFTAPRNPSMMPSSKGLINPQPSSPWQDIRILGHPPSVRVSEQPPNNPDRSTSHVETSSLSSLYIQIHCPTDGRSP